MLDSHHRLQNNGVIDVGSVMDGAGFRRMVNVGADVDAVGTALGIRGMDCFESIFKEVRSSSCLVKREEEKNFYQMIIYRLFRRKRHSENRDILMQPDQ